MRIAAALLLLGLIAATPVRAQQATVVDAKRADSDLRAFEAELQSHDSATAVLQAWCDAHGPAGARIVARRVRGARKAPTPLARAALRLEQGMRPSYRRVDLMCGDKVLSHADNWYLPSKLTPAMDETLERTQTPFGVVVAPLHFTRRNLETSFLFHGAESDVKAIVLPADVLQHSALLYTRDGDPFSFVVETYTDKVLAY